MDYIAPIIFFVLWIVIGNVFDKKKPPADPVPGDWVPPDVNDLPDDMRSCDAGDDEHIEEDDMEELPRHVPHHPDEYQQVHNPYQAYLERHINSGDRDTEVSDAYEIGLHQGKRKLPAMAQAVIWSEVLGRPRALQKRIRFK